MDRGIGSKIAFARNQRNLTQEELAKMVGVKTGTISNLEANKNRSPKMDTLQNIADALNLDIDYFLSDELKIYVDAAKEETNALEKDILAIFYALSPAKKEAVLEFIEQLNIIEHHSESGTNSEPIPPKETISGCSREITDIVSQLDEKNQYFVLDFLQGLTKLKSE